MRDLEKFFFLPPNEGESDGLDKVLSVVGEVGPCDAVPLDNGLGELLHVWSGCLRLHHEGSEGEGDTQAEEAGGLTARQDRLEGGLVPSEVEHGEEGEEGVVVDLEELALPPHVGDLETGVNEVLEVVPGAPHCCQLEVHKPAG